MNINTISANVRFSKRTDEGTHVTIELGSEATLTPEEAQDWKQAQADLYTDLTEQIKTLWPKKANGNNGQTASSNNAQASQSAHYCQEHEAEFKRYEKEGRA